MKVVNKARTIPDVFDKVKNIESKEEKVKMLKAYDTKALRWVVNAMYNVDFSEMKVPKVKFNKRPPEICNLNINTSLARIEAAYHYRVSNPSITERNLIIVLEEVSAPEAELLVSIFNGKKVEGVSKSVFKKAYPSFFLHEAPDESDET